MSETTREKLLAEAEVLVRKRGWSGFSYADLAAAVGLRKASIHHHFHVKEDLGIALIEAYGLRYDQALAQIIASSADGLARVEAYAKLYLHGLELEQGCLAAAMAAELGTLPPRIRDGVAAFFQRHIAWLHQILAEGQINGTIGDDVDPDQSARMVVATLEAP
ncbi:MAG: TetR/AcrR family transcriptional regulator [Methylovirgula sp.]